MPALFSLDRQPAVVASRAEGEALTHRHLALAERDELPSSPRRVLHVYEANARPEGVENVLRRLADSIRVVQLPERGERR
jgi:hypothetical protein